SAEEAESTAGDAAGSSSDITTMSDGKCAILGIHSDTKGYGAYSSVRTLDHNGEPYEVTELPFYINAGYKDLDDICLGFYDDHGYEYYFYGKYTLENGELNIVPGGSAPEIDGDVAPFADELTYKVILEENKFSITIDGEKNVPMYNSLTDDGRMLVSGTLSEGSEAYNGIRSLNLDLTAENEKINSCELVFTDGKKAGDITASYYNVGDFALKYKTVTYSKNGKEMTDNDGDTIFIMIINNYPYGFTIVDSGKTYYYQN
ncbi:MAG: hypothetical protein IIY88_08275, partial [Eubacterium sp.]|nr:hypothetical protein [Eubacterium sp.]